MSEEQLKAFQEAIQSDPSLQQKLQDVKDPGAIVDIAKEVGFTVSAEELQAAQETIKLSVEQLDSAAGGRMYTYIQASCEGFSLNNWDFPTHQ